MRVDLDELVRLAVDLQLGVGPQHVLALVARIRELEMLADAALHGWRENFECHTDFTEDEANAILSWKAVAKRGVILIDPAKR